jgi:hypothetical protein
MWIAGGGSAFWASSADLHKDVWSSTDGINWIEETSAANWVQRGGHTLCAHRGRLWIVGGSDGSFSAPFLKDIWSSNDGVDWRRESPNGSLSARTGHASAVFNNRLWVFGGASNVARYNDVWSYGLHIFRLATGQWDVDSPYSGTFKAREGDGPYTWFIVSGSLPPGLALSTSISDTVALSGVPTETGAWSFTVRVEDQSTGDWAEKEVTLKIEPPVAPDTSKVSAGSPGCTANPAPHLPAAALVAATTTAALILRRRVR